MPIRDTGYQTQQSSKPRKKKSNTEQLIGSTSATKASFDPARAGTQIDPDRSDSAVRTNTPTSSTGQSGQGQGYRGFASRYNEGPGAAELLQRNPEVVLADTMRSMGLSPNGAQYGMVAPSADLANALYLLTNGGKLGTDEQMINWMNGYFGNQLNPSGTGIDIRSALGNLFNAGTGTPLQASLTTDSQGNVLDPSGQVSRLNGLVDAAAQYGVPLIMQQALAGQMGMLGRDYMANMAKGGTANYNDYITHRTNMLTPFVGMG